ncbi:LysR family transcriptional regulator [uncultured Roseobacter sp.]|uniref:LysR family transcriptional regulator n=1 Tax=uncultured Roseobacter sp. TaxID=114847 RepID=UPI0026383A18|nr:LysR family transcriptional regulator [uncultured Roseobacter sp.]
MYSLEDLKTFVEIADRGGITAAARSVGTAPATISHRLSKLESHLGVSLFHRNSRKVTLSIEGEAFYGRVIGILDELMNAETEIGGHGSLLKGHLRVTMAPWILSRFVLPHLDVLRREHPGLTYEFLASDRYVNLVEEQQDCAIRVGRLHNSSLLARKVADNKRILCASAAYLDTFGTPVRPEDLISHRAVCLPWQRKWELGRPGATNFMPGETLLVSNSDSLTDAAIHGHGIALKSRLAVASELNTGALCEILPGVLTKPEAPISVLRPPNLRGSRKVDAFSEFVLARFAARAGS